MLSLTVAFPVALLPAVVLAGTLRWMASTARP